MLKLKILNVNYLSRHQSQGWWGGLMQQYKLQEGRGFRHLRSTLYTIRHSRRS